VKNTGKIGGKKKTPLASSKNDREKRALLYSRMFISLYLFISILYDVAGGGSAQYELLAVGVHANGGGGLKGTVLSFHKQPIRFYRAICNALRQ